MSITFNAENIDWDAYQAAFNAQFDAEDQYVEGYVMPWFPQVNFSNSNAAAIARVIGLWELTTPEGGSGRLGQDRLLALRMAIMRARNSEKVRAPAVTETSVGVGIGGCRWVMCGSDDDAIQARLAALELVVAYCQDHGVDMVWG